jgi:hypothetical protein
MFTRKVKMFCERLGDLQKEKGGSKASFLFFHNAAKFTG